MDERTTRAPGVRRTACRLCRSRGVRSAVVHERGLVRELIEHSAPLSSRLQLGAVYPNRDARVAVVIAVSIRKTAVAAWVG